MAKRGFILSMSLACSLAVMPFFADKSYAHNDLPDSATLNAISGGNEPPQQQGAKKQFKKIEKALKQNMQSTEALIQAAKNAGATPKELADLEKFSVGFLKTFLTAVTPQNMGPGQSADKEPGKKPQPNSIFPGMKPPKDGLALGGPNGAPDMLPPPPPPGSAMTPPPGCPAFMPPQGGPAMAPGIMPGPKGDKPARKAMRPGEGPAAPQGIIITAPDGSQWLVTPQTPVQPEAQAQPNEEIIIIEKDAPLPKWPTKEHLGTDGILKYLERRNAQ